MSWLPWESSVWWLWVRPSLEDWQLLGCIFVPCKPHNHMPDPNTTTIFDMDITICWWWSVVCRVYSVGSVFVGDIWVLFLQGRGPCGRLYGPFPIVAVVVGAMQLGMGVYGFLRAIGICSMSTGNYKFTYVTCATWIVTTIPQCLVEPIYGAGETF